MSVITTDDKHRLALVDALRCFAAFWVVLFHLSEGTHIPTLLATIPPWVKYAVFDAGHLGEILNFWAIYNKRHPAEMGSPDLTMSELMVHHVYCMLYFLGRPASIFATGSNVHFDDPQAHDQLMIVAEYPNGTIANLWGSFSADDRSRDPWSVYFKIIGKNGSSVVPWDTTRFGDARLPFWDDGTYWDSFYQIQKFFLEECLTNKRTPLSTMDDALDAAVIMDVARDSIALRQSIKISYINVDDHFA